MADPGADPRHLRSVAAALDIRVDLVPDGAPETSIDSSMPITPQLHELVARWFAKDLPSWVLAPEVSYCDLPRAGCRRHRCLASRQRAFLVIELKTDIVDVNELVGKVGEKARLIGKIVRDRGWDPLTVSTWVIVAAGRTNRARLTGASGRLAGCVSFGRRGHSGVVVVTRSVRCRRYRCGASRVARPLAPTRRVRRTTHS